MKISELIQRHGQAVALAYAKAYGIEDQAQDRAISEAELSARIDEEGIGEQMSGDRFDA